MSNLEHRRFQGAAGSLSRSSLLSGLIGGIALCIAGVAIFPWDFVLSERLSLANLPGDLARCIELSEFFAHGFGITVILFTAWLLDPASRPLLWRVVAAVILTTIVIHAIKFSVLRVRPMELRDRGIVVQSSFLLADDADERSRIRDELIDSELQSFPSGHSGSVAALAVGLACVYPRGRWWFLILANLACFQRVAVYAHWPSDVLVGAGLGVLIGVLVMNRQRPGDSLDG